MKNNMKILIIRMFPDELNIKNYNCQEIGLAKALIRKGHQCDIILYTQKENYEEDYFFDNNKKIHLYYLKAKNILKNAFFDKKIYDILPNYDIVQSTEYDQIANIKLRRVLKERLIIYHGPYHSNYTKGYKIKCLITDLLILFNKKYLDIPIISKSTLAKKLLLSKGFSNVETIGVGLDVDRFYIEHLPNDNLKIKKLQSEKKEFKYLLYVGKIEDRRNTMFLLEILRKLGNNCKLIVVGNGQKKYKNKLKKYIEKNKLEEKIIYFEKLKQEELKEVYETSDLFIFPSKYEIFGMVLLEAMYFGKIVVSSPNAGADTLINNRENGFILQGFDIEQWKDKIEKILMLPDLSREKIEYNAKTTITNLYVWDKLADKFIEKYEVMIRGKK